MNHRQVLLIHDDPRGTLAHDLRGRQLDVLAVIGWAALLVLGSGIAGLTTALHDIGYILTDHDPDYGAPYDSVPAEMARGSVLVWHGSLWHGGGANHSPQPRMCVTAQYWLKRLHKVKSTPQPKMM